MFILRNRKLWLKLASEISCLAAPALLMKLGGEGREGRAKSARLTTERCKNRCVPFFGIIQAILQVLCGGMTMRIIFFNTLCLTIMFLVGCSSSNGADYESHYYEYRGSFSSLNKRLLKIQGVDKISADGSINYKESASKLDDDEIEFFVSELKRLKIDNVRMYDPISDEFDHHVEYEIGRSGFVNHRVFILIFNNKKEDIEGLKLVDGCSKYSSIEGDWYLRELYDDGVC